ncbi:hypothetical protein [Nonomuraea basaltis]|uniref:hypothetical protein n=1 Tax=Nonomuraea basaltis TaxID=2495887 RepID=UPI00110C5CEB|nr:hypothetical protein [Nonomuraea basaltis]TMR96168.1 hypothetical protein EJK15_24900 [Nonomuraea basaltis]
MTRADLRGKGVIGPKAFASWAHWYRGGFEEIIEAVADPEASEQVMEVFLALLRTGAIRFQTLDVLARLAAAVPGEALRTPARARVAAITENLAALRDRPILAALTADRAVSELFTDYGRRPTMPPAGALPAARRLADRGDLAGALFALSLTQMSGGRTDWADPWREILRDLRGSPHLEVSQAAWDTSVD